MSHGFQYRAAARDVGDVGADIGPWRDTVSEAADQAHAWTFDVDPPFDEVYLERRQVGEPHRHLNIRRPPASGD